MNLFESRPILIEDRLTQKGLRLSASQFCVIATDLD